MDWPTFYEDEVRPKLNAGDVFAPTSHDWTKQRDEEWRGTCPFCGSDNGRVFIVDPGDLSWYCFKCEAGGGPPAYEHRHQGGFGVPNGGDFKEAVRELADTAGVEVPDPDDEEDGEDSRRKRRPLRNPKPRRERKLKAKETAGAAPTRDVQTRHTAEATDSSPTLDTPERELRNALARYRKALKSAARAKAYAKRRGVPPEVLHAYGCGYAPPGEWPQDNSPKHHWEDGRIVTPLTTPEGRLINLHARAVGTCPRKKRHRYWPKNPTPPAAYFNAPAIKDESFDSGEPLVICEGPMDALSFIVEGWERAVAIYNTDGVPWGALRGNVETLVFAFDVDAESETGQTDAPKRAHEATRRGFDAHTLHDEDSYAGHGDPNDALQAGELTLDYLEGIGTEAGGSGRSKNKLMTDGGSGPENKSHDHRPERAAATGNGRSENKPHDQSAEGPESPAGGSGPKAGQSPASQAAGGEGGGGTCEPADLAEYWDGTDVGHLGRWLWKRGGVPEGDVGAGLYADRELHEWIEEKLEAGPQGTSKQTKTRLRWVLWRLYAAHGPEEVPEGQIPVPPMRRE
jgi:hypothetical protein